MPMRSINRRQILAFGCAFVARYFFSWTRFPAVHAENRGSVSARFGVLSDPHIDLDGVNSWLLGEESLHCLAATVRALNGEKLDFVLILGDLLHNGEQSDLLEAKKVLDTLVSPYFIVAGNHDFQIAGSSTMTNINRYISHNDFVAAFTGHGYNGSGRSYWAHTILPGLRLIGLDGCHVKETRGYGGRLDKQQIQWLRHQLSTNTDDLHIIMLHHNLIRWGNDGLSQRGHWFSLDNSEDVRAILESYSDAIAVVLSGHRHIGLRRSRFNGVDYMVIPSINSYPMRYALFQLDGDDLRWETYEVPVDRQLHLAAQRGLLEDPSILSVNKMDEKELLTFYTNNQLIKGLIHL